MLLSFTNEDSKTRELLLEATIIQITIGEDKPADFSTMTSFEGLVNGTNAGNTTESSKDGIVLDKHDLLLGHQFDNHTIALTPTLEKEGKAKDTEESEEGSDPSPKYQDTKQRRKNKDNHGVAAPAA